MKVNAEALYQQAQRCLEEDPPAYHKAMPLLKASANSGGAEAAYLLAHCYMEGLGVEQDAVAGQDWLNIATELGHNDATYNLLLVREKNGETTVALLADYIALAEAGYLAAQIRLMHYYATAKAPQALLWAERALEEEHPHAQYHLAILFKHGHGVEANIETACNWLEAAIGNGHEQQNELRSLLRQWQWEFQANNNPT